MFKKVIQETDLKFYKLTPSSIVDVCEKRVVVNDTTYIVSFRIINRKGKKEYQVALAKNPITPFLFHTTGNDLDTLVMRINGWLHANG